MAERERDSYMKGKGWRRKNGGKSQEQNKLDSLESWKNFTFLFVGKMPKTFQHFIKSNVYND